ncbi:MAG: hypothetical protein ACRCXZ_00945, partial [Patescibacteria group bacterium]
MTKVSFKINNLGTRFFLAPLNNLFRIYPFDATSNEQLHEAMFTALQPYSRDSLDMVLMGARDEIVPVFAVVFSNQHDYIVKAIADCDGNSAIFSPKDCYAQSGFENHIQLRKVLRELNTPISGFE